MKLIQRMLSSSLVFAMLFMIGCSADGLVGSEANENIAVESAANGNACWGQASAVFAKTGEMGEHSSSQGEPRLGLANLAELLFEAGVIAEDSMQALGAFVANELGLSIDACM